MKVTYLILFAFTVMPGFVLSQKDTLTLDETLEKKYKQRIRQSFIHGVYIPKDLADAFQQLNKLIDKASKKKFKEVPEEIAVKKLHFSLGRWMIYNWGFYEGSRLSYSLRKIGVSHPDDMARFVIMTYHRYLNKEDLNVKELAETFANYRKEERKNRKSQGKVIYEEKRKRQDE